MSLFTFDSSDYSHLPKGLVIISIDKFHCCEDVDLKGLYYVDPPKKATSIDFIAHCAMILLFRRIVNISRSISIARDLLLAFRDVEDLPCLQDHQAVYRVRVVRHNGSN